MSESNFGPTGLDIGNNNRNLTYLYGLSDFWASMFEDSDKIELLMEANSVKMSDIYSKFLQLTSTLSLANIETNTSQQIKLYIISDTDAVQGQVNTYTLATSTLGSKLIANRPFLPTTTLQANSDYRISSDGTQIIFSKPLSEFSFPVRVTSTGVKQYSLWMVDVALDEQFIYDYYGKLLDVSPETSTENFKSFVYGLYYLFTNGPTLSLLSKGLNLVLGIPLARETETVLDIRKYLNTDQFLVITDLNQYLVPYGLAPSVAIGDVLEATQEIAQWVEVKDWQKDGDWWINLQIPPAVMPYIPTGEPDRYAKPGTYADYLMRNFLKKHVFLVNVKTIDFKNLQTFEKLSQLIGEAKPKYTYPIYIWTVPTGSETMLVDDTAFSLRWDQFKCDNLTAPVPKMRRLNVIWSSFSADHDSKITVTGNTLTYNMPAGAYASARANTAVSLTDETYFEATIGVTEAATNIKMTVGLGNTTAPLTNYVGFDANSWGYNTDSTGTSYKVHSATPAAYGASFVTGDVIGVYYQPTVAGGTLTFYKNGVSQGVAYTGVSGTLYPMFSTSNYQGASVDFNFGERRWAYTPPTTTVLGVYSTDTPLTRGCPQFTRYNVPPKIGDLLGVNPGVNGYPSYYEGTIINGFINYVNNFRTNTPDEAAWMRTFHYHQQDVMRIPHSYVDFSRPLSFYDNSGQAVTTNTLPRIVPLYATTQADLVAKFATVGAVPPGLSTWQFTLFKQQNSDAGINVVALNQTEAINYFQIMQTTFATFFSRSANVYYLGNFMPKEGYKQYSPQVSDLMDGDYLMFIRIYENTVGVYWVTSNQTLFVPPCFVMDTTDTLTLSIDQAPLSRGLGLYSPFYFLRGDGVQFLPGQSQSINGYSINGDLGDTGLIPTTYYSDVYNPVSVPIDRSGKKINIQRTTV